MQTKMVQVRLAVILLLLTIASSGCGGIEIGLEPSPTPAPLNILITTTPVPAPTSTPLPGDAAASNPGAPPTPDWPYQWMALRDTHYNYGLAIPCYWTIYPSPLEGYNAAMTLTSYTEEFYQANSQKGYWEWPEGAMKMDWIVFEGILPDQSTTSAVEQTLNTSDQYVESIEEITLGETPALKVVIVSTRGETQEAFTSIIFRMEVDKLLLVGVYPNERLDNPIIQAVLASYTAPTDDSIPLPQISPGEPPGNYDGPCGPAR